MESNKEHVTIINVPEAVGVFDTFETLQAAFYDLRSVGFHHSDISLLGGKEVLEEKLGKSYWQASELEDDPRAPRAHFVSEEAIGELEGATVGESVTDGVSGDVGVVAGTQAAKKTTRMSITTRTEKLEKVFVFIG